ncbi:MAG: DNA mismatch repair protein MutS [bacterium]|nr:DNA mismatch repair protein MutS [bacterium]
MSDKNLTPMLQQYFEIKKEHTDAFLFFRLGDFYEMFGDDAKEGARLLGLTLTARHKGTQSEIPMCGIPHHSAERYIAQLTRLGKRVAICDQVSDPGLPGIVKREVVRVVTPGTTLDESVTDTAQNNYILSVAKDKQVFGLSMLDIATGEFRVTEIKELKTLKNLLFLLSPSELLLDTESTREEIRAELEDRSVTLYQLPHFEDPEHFLLNHFQVSTLSGFGVAHMTVGIRSAAALLSYAKETQKTKLEHIRKLVCYRFSDIMILDESSIRNLELLHTARDFKKEGSLLHVMDITLTRMGARKLRHWLLAPLTNKEKINLRLEAVADLVAHQERRVLIQQELKDIFDLERLVGRIGCKAANARDLNYLKVNLLKIPSIKLALLDSPSSLVTRIEQQLELLKELVHTLDERISSEPVATITEGGMIADGFHKELDELRDILKNGKTWLLEYQQNLRLETGISSLKVKYNKIFGYHIEISKANRKDIPEYFELRQTLVNAERYMTPELKEFEGKYLSAEEKIKTLEYELFQETLELTIPFIDSIQRNADLIAVLDVLQSFAQLALDEHYCRPLIKEEIGIEIRDGRHPVIESVLKKQNQIYIANDANLDETRQITVLTGPNMAGKSSYLRQVALITLMAHMGSFVPARSANISITDRIFTRVGASDNISTGQSTFMVEMSEAANILNNATERSLIIFDELGRGTSTYDGVSIAWAILEHLAQELKALTLFATHYHELIDVAKEIPNACNASVAVAEKDGEVVFLRKIIDGGVDRSYGIEVAKLAGLPQSVIRRAKGILSELEKDRFREEQTLMGIQPDLFTSAPNTLVQPTPSPHRALVERLKEADLNNMTPVEALNCLSALKKSLQ